MNRQELFEHCLFVRNTIEQCRKEEGILSGFPYGHCNNTCIWLYDYLAAKGLIGMEFRMRDPFLPHVKVGNHVWLHWNGYDMDITCDQFNEYGYSFSPVYVGDNSNELYQNYNDVTNRMSSVDLEYGPGSMNSRPSSWNECKTIYKALGITCVYNSKSPFDCH